MLYYVQVYGLGLLVEDVDCRSAGLTTEAPTQPSYLQTKRGAAAIPNIQTGRLGDTATHTEAR